MSWKKRATPVTQESSTSSWKNRATIVGETPSISKTESALAGLEQGLSFGAIDELLGKVESWSTAQELKKMGLEAENLSPEAKKLAEQQSYENVRDRYRQEYEQAQEANPLTYGAAMIGGGIATGGLTSAAAKGLGIGSNLAINALEGAAIGAGVSEQETLGGIAQDAAKGALGGAILSKTLPKTLTAGQSTTGKLIQRPLYGAASGAALMGGMSQGDVTTEQGREELVEDIGTGAKYGAVAGLFPALFPAIKPVAKALVGPRTSEYIEGEFAAGRQGESIASPEWQSKKAALERTTAKEISDPIVKRKNEILDELAAIENQTDASITKGSEEAIARTKQLKQEYAEIEKLAKQQAKQQKFLDTKELKDLEQSKKKLSLLEEQKFNATTQEQLKLANEDIYKEVLSIQKQIDPVKNQLGKERDLVISKIDDTIEKIRQGTANQGVEFNLDVTGTKQALVETLQQMATTQPHLAVGANSFIREVLSFPSQLNSVRQIMSFNTLLNKLQSSREGALRGIAKKSYGETSQSLYNFIENTIGNPNEAKKLKEIQRRFASIYDLEDRLGKSQLSRHIDSETVDKAGYTTIKKLADSIETPDIKEVEELQKLVADLGGEAPEQFNKAIERARAVKKLEKQRFNKQEYVESELEKALSERPDLAERLALSNEDRARDIMNTLLESRPELKAALELPEEAAKANTTLSKAEELGKNQRYQDLIKQKQEIDVFEKVFGEQMVDMPQGDVFSSRLLNILKGTVNASGEELAKANQELDVLLNTYKQVVEPAKYEQMLQKLKETAKNTRLSALATGNDGRMILTPSGPTVWASFQKAAGKLANFSGKAVKKATDISTKSKKVKELMPENLVQKAAVIEQTLGNSPTGKYASDLLRNAANESDPTKRAAMLFMFKQTPAYREIEDKEIEE